MPTTVQARFDEKARAALDRLAKANGWTISQALRECVLRVDEQTAAQHRPKLIGAGCFDSGSSNFAPGTEGMEGFGRKWRVDEQGNGRWDW